MDGMGQILMHADILPPDAAGVRVERFPGAAAFEDVQPVFTAILAQFRQIRHARADTRVILQPPAAQMVAHRYDTWLDTFCHPNFVHEVADFRFHANQIAGNDAHAFGIGWVHPDRIFVADFV